MNIIDSLIAKKIVGGGGGGGSVPEYAGPYTVTPSEQTQTLATDGKKCTDDITVNPIPSSYIVPTGTKQITQNGTGIDVAAYADVDVNVPTGITPAGTISITQNGQVDVTNYATADVNVPTGGGVVEAPMKDVNFYDYDGTRLYSYTASEFLAFSAMPANPTHTGLTAQGWNWTLADAKEQVEAMGAADIGQMYITDDGKTRIYIHLEDGRLEPCLSLGVAGTLTIDWGDNSSENITGNNITNTVNTKHTYKDPGDYIISITPLNTSAFVLGGSGRFILNKTGKTDSDATYSNCIEKVEIGSGVPRIDAIGFNRCASLRSVTIPYGIGSIGNDAFNKCYSLRAIVLPSGISTFGSSIFMYCSALQVAILPKGMTAMCNFSACYALKKVSIPNGMTTIPASSFYQDYALTSVAFPNSITSIGSSAYNGCNGLGLIRFMSSNPPSVGSSNVFNSVQSDCKIEIPYASLAAYLIATNYPSPSTHTYIGFATYESGATLPTQDTTEAYNVVWYASKEDAIAQTNPITVGNGNEIYCRYTAV